MMRREDYERDMKERMMPSSQFDILRAANDPKKLSRLGMSSEQMLQYGLNLKGARERENEMAMKLGGTQALTPELENLKRNDLLRSGGLKFFQGGPKTTEEAFSAFQKAKPYEKEQAWSSVEGMMQGEQDEEERKKMYEEYMKKKSLTQTPTRKELPMSELGMLRESMGRMIG
jgi:hypothetical protein